MKFFLYIKKWRWPWVSVPHWALALVLHVFSVPSFMILPKQCKSYKVDTIFKLCLNLQNAIQVMVLILCTLSDLAFIFVSELLSGHKKMYKGE